MIAAGTRLGPYEIVAPLGAGGMGEVWRARDTRLDRSVAIKVLPAAYSADAQLKSRFDREAKAISQLNHPNICSLFDVGHQDGIDFLVMELIEGRALSGPLPLPDVIRYGIQIAEALERAHKNGIVHRDLKPQNVMITKSGIAKLLDFGLAKPTAVDLGADGPTEQQITREGTIVGTFHYMSPEQLDGQHVDHRSDIFALGAVLYEMVTGRHAFSGSTQTSVIAAIVSGEPPLLGELEPPALRQLIEACLAKDPDARMQSAHDVALQLRSIGTSRVTAGGSGRSPWIVAGVFALLLAAGLAYHFKTKAVAQPLRFNIAAPPGTAIEGPPAISPDGRRIVFRAVAADGSSSLWMRELDVIEAHPLKGTEGASFAFWSADGKNIGFIGRGKLWRLDPADGSIRTIYTRADDPPGGATWNAHDDVIVAPTTEGTMYRVSASGGAAVLVKATAEQRGYWPSFLPDGDHFLYCREFAPPGESGIYVGSLDSGKTKKLVIEDHDFMLSRAEYADGNIYYTHGDSLYMQPFDPRALELRGQPVKIDDEVAYPAPNRAAFSVSRGGTLVYHKAGSAIISQLSFVDRAGHPRGPLGPVAPYGPFELSPDGKQLVYARNEDAATTWILDVARGTSTRAVFEVWSGGPMWLPDGQSILYTAADDGPPNVYVRRGAAKSECLIKTDIQNYATSATPDGVYAIFDKKDPRTNFDVAAVSIAAPHRSFSIVSTPYNERGGKVSPDGKWLAYMSDESGTTQAYTMAFPSGASRVQISTNGCIDLRWSRDGREIFYLQPRDKMLMSVKVNEAAAPQPLFAVPSLNFDRTRDGFLVAENRVNADAPGLTVVMKK